MSSFYYRVTPEPEKVEGYGFKKVNQAELSDILERVTKATYSSRVQYEESEQVHNYRRIRSAHPPRTPTYCQRRRVSYGPIWDRFGNDQRLTEIELQRTVRRVRKPTKAFHVSQKDYEPSEDGEMFQLQDTISRSKTLTATEKKKAFHQLSRPTTASRAKNVKECYLCDPSDVENNNSLVPFEYPYADDQSVTKEEVASIISRVSSPTKASQKGIRPCWKTPPNLEELHYMDERLPLVSGLHRSRSVNHIVNRLHTTKGTYNKKSHGYSVQATPVTDFYGNQYQQ